SSLRRVSFDLHNAAGTYSAFFVLILAVTGIAIGFDDEIFPWIYRITNSAPPPRNSPSTARNDVHHISPDEAIRVARTVLPGATPIAFVGPPNPKASYYVSMRFPEDRTPGGRSWVNVDQYDGKVL